MPPLKILFVSFSRGGWGFIIFGAAVEARFLEETLPTGAYPSTTAETYCYGDSFSIAAYSSAVIEFSF